MTDEKAVYGRISEDTEASGAGVERQIKDGTSLCEIRGWTTRPYVDNDLSAFKRSVTRPAFEQMLADLQAGVVSGIVAYNLDRLARQPRDLERIIEIYDDNPALTFATVEGDINLASADGRTMARVMVAFANKSSLDTGRRTARKHLELAEAGEPVGRRTFGWKDDKRTLDPREAAFVTTAVRDLLAGSVGVRELARRWNEQGAKTTTGGEWSHQAIRKYMKNPRLVGDRMHRGELVRNAEGDVVKGTWEPMLDRDTFDRLQINLDSRSQGAGTTQARRGARKYHLTGLLRCGVCNGLMFGMRTREGHHAYTCNTGSDHTLSASGPPVDRLVDALGLAWLQSEPIDPAPQEEWEGAGRLAEIGDQIKALMDSFLAGQLSEAVVFPRVQALEAEQVQARQRRAQWLERSTGPTLSSETEETWASYTPEARRGFLEIMLDAVYVRPPATRRASRFAPERLEPVWRRP